MPAIVTTGARFVWRRETKRKGAEKIPVEVVRVARSRALVRFAEQQGNLLTGEMDSMFTDRWVPLHEIYVR